MLLVNGLERQKCKNFQKAEPAIAWLHLSSVRSHQLESTESERVGFCSGIEKLNFESPVHNRSLLPDQVIHSRLDDSAIALFVDVGSVRGPRYLTVCEHAESNRCSLRSRSHDEMKIPRVKLVNDAAMWQA